MNIWSPRADLEAGEVAVLPVEPQLAIQVGQIQPVPFLVGVAESEGVWRAVNYLTQAGWGGEGLVRLFNFLKDFESAESVFFIILNHLFRI